MPFTIPTLSQTLDTLFTRTFFKVRRDAVDNVLTATPIWAALKNAGCLKPKVGGNMITRTIRHTVGTPSQEIDRGSTLSEGETDTRTMAYWTWRYVEASISRNMIDDQTNSGPDQIQDYVVGRTMEAFDVLREKFESALWNTHVTDETGKKFQGLLDLIPPVATRATGTYGRIARPTTFTNDVPTAGNTFWTPKYFQGTTPKDVALRKDMDHAYNSIDANQGQPPNLIITTQELYELYTDFATDASHIVKDASTFLADLGFQVVRFKGKPMIWSPNAPANEMRFVNTNHVSIVYDPNFWFHRKDWVYGGPRSMDMLAHIMCAYNMITDQPRRHGLLYW